MFLFKYFSTRSDNKPGQEVKNVFLFLLFTRIEWGYRMMRDGNPWVYLLICAHKHYQQNIRQELGTLSLDYYIGSN